LLQHRPASLKFLVKRAGRSNKNMKSSKSTQEFVPIKEVRDGVIILKDNSLRMILMASSLNFALKSQEEQEAILFQYQNFLNSLEFSSQFFIQSRKLNINPYINALKDLEKEQTNELLRIQTREYIEFVKNLVETINIVSKNFFVVVSYFPPVLEVGKKGLFSIITKFIQKTSSQKAVNQKEKFNEYKEQLFQRVNVVTQELLRTGVRVVPLGTEEALELFYHLFNPGEEEKQKVPLINL
jgi:cysteinyl-tRNA synthetase